MSRREWGEAVGESTGARRVAATLLRAAGGRSVMLRLPAAATPGDATEQLGLAAPAFQDVELSPVVYRRVRTVATKGMGVRREMLASAETVEAAAGVLGGSAANVLFADAAGVVVDGVLMEVESVTASEVFGVPYLYRVVLREPVALAI